MEFPVDLLVSGRHEDLESSAQSYMNKLLYSRPDHTQYLTLPSARKIQISPANVGFVPLYGANLKHKVLALFAPEDQFTAVALFLADQWYTVEDALRTSDPAREGLIKVRSVGERIALYVLNRIIYRTGEMALNEVPFLCHAEDDYAKILWKNGEAVGFHSVKSKGSLCNSFVSQCYLLPVMDSIFVRKDHRGNGHGLQMLEDFVDSFKDDELGLKYPLTQAMQRICSRYLSTYPADVDLLWEVEGVGGPYQKAKVANRLASLALRCNHSSWVADDNKNGEVVVNEVEMNEVEMNEESCLDITEEVVAVNKHLKVAEEIVELPVSTCTRSSGHKQKKRLREEPDESAGENPPEKINRSAKEETEVQPDAVEPDAVVPEAKDAADGETEGEREEETSSVQADEIMAEPENPVNGKLSDSMAEKEEGSTDTPEDVQSGQECSLEAEPVNQNGPAEEEMMEQEGESESQEAPVEKEDVIDNPEQSEEPTAEVELVSEGKQEAVEEEHEEEEASSAVEEKSEEEVAPAVEEEQQKDVPSAVEEEPEAVPRALEEEQEEDVPSAVEEEPEEEVAPVVEEAQEKEVAKDVDQPQAVFEASSEAPVLLADMEEGECVQQDSETLEDPSSSPLDNSVEEASGVPIEGEQEEKAIMETEEPTVSQNEMANCELLVESQSEDTKKEETNDKDEQNEEENTTATTTEDEKEEEKSSEETSDSPDVRVLRGGRSKPVPPTPKRTSSRLSKAAVIEEVEEELEEEEEEKLTSAEEEKGSTEEDEAPEHNSEEEEEPPVIDMRVLRRKTKVIQSVPRPKAKRRSKN
ncbi:soluble lamin-associated protein of 75 kDa [Triplophysa rosa]|uniref:Soluble lamin-associated protein of 75 kDa n=1 Tax=Triplophysa rosa TaxID=992332 RepID=A0A9W7TGU0_TRIRA|nr:soluble lamin-associated protein of 75 kDa [Triplophysa rosa]XP_057216791.1 soluble lamin-associated protein of 75 kDa [Triplophysa rosa]KAI7795774.1 putative soluble lamin-associated protein of 75 kDa [Triplophysa rosa]